MDSLDNFANEGLGLNGLFKSGGIFPDFEEKLSIQKDYSLGFIRKTPENGFNIYDQLANYDNEIRLSNEGLKGSGAIEFLHFDCYVRRYYILSRLSWSYCTLL